MYFCELEFLYFLLISFTKVLEGYCIKILSLFCLFNGILVFVDWMVFGVLPYGLSGLLLLFLPWIGVSF
jgi:hypothetical protein